MDDVSLVLADADVDRRVELKKMLWDHASNIGEADNYEQTLSVVKEERPEILLLSYPLNGGGDPEDFVETVAVEAPRTEIILIADSMEESESARRLQRMGARDALVRPIEEDEIVRVIEDVVDVARRKQEKLTEMMSGKSPGGDKRRGRLISIFSTKGGVGRSLLATNLACQIRKLTEKSVALVDLDLQFGDDAIMLDMTPTTAIGTLARDCEDRNEVDYELLERYMHTHEPSGVDLLAAPPRPEEADYVQERETEMIVEALKKHYHYVVVDTSSQVTEPVIAALENSDLIMLLLTLELPTIKDGKLMLELVDNLGLSRDKVQVIMNRDQPNSEIDLQEVEEALEQEVLGGLPSEGDLVMPSVNEGLPIVLSHPESGFATRLDEHARRAIGGFLDLEDEIIDEEKESASGSVDLPLGPLGSRVAAGFIDFALAYVVGWGSFILLGLFVPLLLEGTAGALIGTLVGASGVLVPLGYYGFLQAGPQTLGYQLMGLEVTDEEGTSLGLGTSLMRSLLGFLGLLLLGIGPLMVLLTANRQGLHDLLAGTYVLSRGESEEGNTG